MTKKEKIWITIYFVIGYSIIFLLIAYERGLFDG